jgi:hypothetical protein
MGRQIARRKQKQTQYADDGGWCDAAVDKHRS